MADGPDTQPTLIMDPGPPQGAPPQPRPRSGKRRANLRHMMSEFVGPILFATVVTILLYTLALPRLRERDVLHMQDGSQLVGDIVVSTIKPSSLSIQIIPIEIDKESNPKPPRKVSINDLRADVIVLKEGNERLEGRIVQPERRLDKDVRFKKVGDEIAETYTREEIASYDRAIVIAKRESWGHWTWEKLADRGWIPVICTFLLFWHLSLVFIRRFTVIRREFQVLGMNLIPPGVGPLTDADLATMSQRTVAAELATGGTLLTRRILLAIANLGINRNTTELGDLLRRRAEADRVRSSTAYAIPNFIFWAIPILGFVGTVLGIGNAVSNLDTALGSMAGTQNQDQMIGALSLVASNLGVAFDTTLVALLMSIVAFLVQTFVRRKEAELLADVEDFLTYRLQSRIETEGVEMRMETVMREAMEDQRQLQQRYQEEQSERSMVSMQTMMGAQDTLRDALEALPLAIGESGAASVEAIVQMRDKIGELAAAVRESAAEGFREGRVELEKAMEHMLENLEEITKRVGDQMTAVGWELNSEFTQIGEKLRTAMIEGSDHIRTDMQALQQAFLDGVGDRGEEILARISDRFRQSADPLDESLRTIADRLASVFESGQEIVSLETAMRENLDQLVRLQKMDQTFGEVHASLVSLRPILSQLARPIPIRLTLAGVELPDASDNGGAGNLDRVPVIAPVGEGEAEKDNGGEPSDDDAPAAGDDE